MHHLSQPERQVRHAVREGSVSDLVLFHTDVPEVASFVREGLM